MNNIMKNEKPKVCVPIVAITTKQIIEELNIVSKLNVDIIEIRIDFFEGINSITDFTNLCKEINTCKTNKTLLLTYRSKTEGGNILLSTEYISQLFEVALEENTFDIYDIEYCNEVAIKLCKLVHAYNKKVIYSHHNFDKTPTCMQIVEHLKTMATMGGDICKIAVMPKTANDVLVLLQATVEASNQIEVPIVTMSMNGIGLVSRLSGQIFGSSITFARYKEASAPGQIDVDELNRVLALIEQNI